ncbi:AAA family ATPase [Streptococcus mitis]|uniref:AAA family ATPase n=1 Tax=Streptococcus mitis TaxID=28037 RepID=UPI0021B7AA66|nr:AAA family ATPase [Streptococcus mitis]
MLKIEEIKIANYRSYKENGNEITNLSKINVMVGKNNVGKTNLLRAIYLFFNPASFNPSVDINYIKKITGGASKLPKIDITFSDDEILNSKSDGFKKYTISCNLNKLEKKGGVYSLITQNADIKSKLKSNSDIKNYLEKK